MLRRRLSGNNSFCAATKIYTALRSRVVWISNGTVRAKKNSKLVTDVIAARPDAQACNSSWQHFRADRGPDRRPCGSQPPPSWLTTYFRFDDSNAHALGIGSDGCGKLVWCPVSDQGQEAATALPEMDAAPRGAVFDRSSPLRRLHRFRLAQASVAVAEAEGRQVPLRAEPATRTTEGVGNFPPLLRIGKLIPFELFQRLVGFLGFGIPGFHRPDEIHFHRDHRIVDRDALLGRQLARLARSDECHDRFFVIAAAHGGRSNRRALLDFHRSALEHLLDLCRGLALILRRRHKGFVRRFLTATVAEYEHTVAQHEHE